MADVKATIAYREEFVCWASDSGDSQVVRIPLHGGRIALADVTDAALIGQFRWHAHVKGGRAYATRGMKKPDGSYTKQFMHTLITGYPIVDHINGDGLDNRRANLRPATKAQNMHNTLKRPGASRFKGVSASKKRWRACITVDAGFVHLGSFGTEDEAAQAYDAAARRHFGSYARLNFPSPGERSALKAGKHVS